MGERRGEYKGGGGRGGGGVDGGVRGGGRNWWMGVGRGWGVGGEEIGDICKKMCLIMRGGGGVGVSGEDTDKNA